ncbi:basic salivary proline-rich protein 1-like [Anolis carolinensis]|uniref:basic salivary proline-rich protein 1-like n=1 Tax=Anolis carolinensis TaxID=28377 RepID=UPI002F2B4D27
MDETRRPLWAVKERLQKEAQEKRSVIRARREEATQPPAPPRLVRARLFPALGEAGPGPQAGKQRPPRPKKQGPLKPLMGRSEPKGALPLLPGLPVPVAPSGGARAGPPRRRQPRRQEGPLGQLARREPEGALPALDLPPPAPEAPPRQDPDNIWVPQGRLLPDIRLPFPAPPPPWAPLNMLARRYG